MTDYRVIVRVDGQGTWDKPITPKTEQHSHGQWLWKRDDLLRFEPSLSLSILRVKPLKNEKIGSSAPA